MSYESGTTGYPLSLLVAVVVAEVVLHVQTEDTAHLL